METLDPVNKAPTSQRPQKYVFSVMLFQVFFVKFFGFEIF